MLELRPNCELCNCDLGPESKDAMICTYECTYCINCAEGDLHNVCPTCGGGFEKRPVRPSKSWRPELKLGLQNHPASSKRVHTGFSRQDIDAHVGRIKHIAPEDR
ncbi:MAG: DUF1272 domain-containing protein [Alphaproteobacteria bacterium]